MTQSKKHVRLAQARLTKTAMESNDATVRLHTVRRLTDQNVLAKFASEDEDPSVRCAAIAKLKDEPVLARIVAEDKHSDVVRAAIARLSDQTALARLAMDDARSYVRSVAVRKLDDLALMLRIAVEDEVEEVRQAATATLMQWSLFDRPGIDDRTTWFRTQGVREMTLQIMKLRDQALLARFALEGKYTCLRCAAVGNLTDQPLLGRIASDDRDSDVVRAAVAKISDQSILAGIAADGLDNYVRFEAIRRLNDETRLAQIVLHKTFRNDVRSQEPLNSRYRDNGLRRTAVCKIRDQGILVRLAIGTPYTEVMNAALDRITDEAALETIAEEATNNSQRDAARRRLVQLHADLQDAPIKNTPNPEAAPTEVTTDEPPRRVRLGEFIQSRDSTSEQLEMHLSAQISDEATLDSLLEAVKSRTLSVSSAACWTLGKIKPSGAAMALLPFLDSNDKYLTSRIVFALRKLADASVSDALIHQFASVQDLYLKGDFAAAIAATGGTKAVSMLVPMLHDRSVALCIRKGIASGFGDSREPAVLDELIVAYQKYPESPHYDEADLCEECLRSVGKYGNPKTIDLLCSELFWSHSHRTPQIARDGLVRIGAPAVPALIVVLERMESKSNVFEYEREATISALMNIGGAEATRAIQRSRLFS